MVYQIPVRIRFFCNIVSEYFEYGITLSETAAKY